MPLQRRHRALYAAFDRFPSRKGSAVHIDRFARTLFEQAGGGVLYAIGGPGLIAQMRDLDPDRVDELVEVYRAHNEPLHETLESFTGILELLPVLRAEL